MPAWTEYAETLSVRLSPAEFEDVTQSVSELSRFSKHIRDTPRAPQEPYWTLSQSMVADSGTCGSTPRARSTRSPRSPKILR